MADWPSHHHLKITHHNLRRVDSTLGAIFHLNHMSCRYYLKFKVHHILFTLQANTHLTQGIYYLTCKPFSLAMLHLSWILQIVLKPQFSSPACIPSQENLCSTGTAFGWVWESPSVLYFTFPPYSLIIIFYWSFKRAHCPILLILIRQFSQPPIEPINLLFFSIKYHFFHKIIS